MIKGLQVVKCKTCGKTTLEEEFHIHGCTCGSHEGMDNAAYKRRDYLKGYVDNGWLKCQGKFIKRGCVHYRHQSKYALISDLMIDGEYITNHTYVQNVGQLSYNLLADVNPGDIIHFEAKVHGYHKDTKYGMSEMIRLEV